MSRNSRQSKILDIITNNQIETQEELAEALRSSGFAVTQATVSRDIKELNLVKTLTDNNRYKYVTVNAVDSKLSVKFINLFKETVVSVVTASNLIVVKTIAGSAAAVGSVIEQLNLNEIIGVVNGTNSLLIVTSSAKDATKVASKLNSMQN